MSTPPAQKFLLDATYLDCGICMRVMYKPVSLYRCMHKFCKVCILRWWSMEDSCPSCRSRIRDVVADPLVQTVVEQFLRDCPEAGLSLEERQEADGQEEHYARISEERLNERDRIYVDLSLTGSEEEDGSERLIPASEDDDYNVEQYVRLSESSEQQETDQSLSSGSGGGLQFDPFGVTVWPGADTEEEETEQTDLESLQEDSGDWSFYSLEETQEKKGEEEELDQLQPPPVWTETNEP